MTKLNLYLGCNGNADKSGFVYCTSCSNILIDISSLEEQKRDKVMDFLDKAAGLFSGPVENHSKSFNIINFLHRDFGIFEKDHIIQIQKFFQIHKECGIYLVIIPEKK